jgi:hypothetical protein
MMSAATPQPIAANKASTTGSRGGRSIPGGDPPTIVSFERMTMEISFCAIYPFENVEDSKQFREYIRAMR